MKVLRCQRCYTIAYFFYCIQDDTLLVIGWGTSVKIASIRTNQNKGANGTYKHAMVSSLNQVDIVASFQTSYSISGIAPFGDSLVVLAYIPGEEDGDKEFSSTIPSRQVFSCHILGIIFHSYGALACCIFKLISLQSASQCEFCTIDMFLLNCNYCCVYCYTNLQCCFHLSTIT